MAMFFKYFKILSFIGISILVGCNPNAIVTTPTSTAQATTTNLPNLKYQLTYVMPYELDGTEYQGIFAVDIQCLDEEMVCFGSPELLLKIPKQSDINPLNPYGRISSYSWSPSGMKIAFSAIGRDERSDIFVADWNGNNLKNITMSPQSEIFPSWSIDSQLIYTVCDGRCHAVISDENGKNATTFPFNSVVVFASWMPDGDQVLFVGADNNSVYQIYTANVNGSDVKQITQTVENNIVEDASTNGALIFFTRLQTYVDNNFNYNIFSIDIEGKMENAVTVDEELISFNPSVAPFGNWLAFQQGRETHDIYVSSFDGKQIFQATNDDEDKRVPEWRVVVSP